MLIVGRFQFIQCASTPRSNGPSVAAESVALARFVRPFREGLSQVGYFEGKNIAIEHRWAEGQYNRLPDLAADLVQRKVTVIAIPSSTPAAVATKNATTTIPIVFGIGGDPVRLGLVTSLGRPGGNATGINFLINELVAKRLELLHELLPAASRVAVLANPTNQVLSSSNIREVEAAARAIGLQIQVFSASTMDEVDAAFAAILRERMHALFTIPDAFLGTRRVQLATLAARHALPTAYPLRDYVEVGGLMSYGILPTSKDLPSSLVQLRIAVWTGDTRDTRPTTVIGRPNLL
jgi:putative ABC transport system substrate-binding protein